MSTQLQRDPADIAAEHLSAGRVAEAQAIFEEVLGRQPTHARALCGLGSIALRRGEVERGFELISHAATIAPHDGFTIGNLAVAYLARNELQLAEDCCRRALDLESKSADLHANFATVLAARGDLPTALVAQRHALELDPDSAIQHFNLANLLVAAGDGAGAAAGFQAAVDLDPGHIGALNNLAVLLKQAGRLDAASTLLEDARLRDPLNPELLANQADLLLRKGRSEQALEQIRRAIGLAPRAPALQSTHGAMLMELGRLDEAARVLADALRLAPDDTGIVLTLARLLVRQGRLDAAQAALDRIAASGKDVAPIAPLVVDLLLKRGRYDDAWSHLEARAKPAAGPFADLDLGPDVDLSGKAARFVAINGASSLFAARCLPTLADRGLEITVICPPMLASLFETVPGVRGVVALAELDLAALASDGPPLLDLDMLPQRLRLTPDAPSVDWPLFEIAPAADPAAAPRTGQRIGIWWEGAGPGDTLIDALAGLSDATVVSVQSGAARTASKPRLDDAGIVDRGGAVDDFRSLAAQILDLDRMIVPDGPIAHLAAALGIETWVLVERDGSWHWPDGSGPAAWYPRTRVFRQAADGGWTATLKAVRAALEPRPAEPVEPETAPS